MQEQLHLPRWERRRRKCPILKEMTWWAFSDIYFKEKQGCACALHSASCKMLPANVPPSSASLSSSRDRCRVFGFSASLPSYIFVKSSENLNSPLLLRLVYV